jgi:hypothetical protein
VLAFLLLGGGIGGTWGLYHTQAVQRVLRTLGADDEAATPVADPGTATPGTILPDTIFVRPSYRVATFVSTNRRIGREAGKSVEADQVVTAEVDYITPIASFVFENEGTISGITARQQGIQTSEYFYKHVGLAADPWVRTPRPWDQVPRDRPGLDAGTEVGFLPMYQDVVSSEVRARATNVIATNDVVLGIPVTTYQFDAPWNTFPEFAYLGSPDPSWPRELHEVHVTLSVDVDGFIRVTDYQFAEQAWMDRAAVSSEDFFWRVHVRMEITSTSIEPSTVAPPESFIEAVAG